MKKDCNACISCAIDERRRKDEFSLNFAFFVIDALVSPRAETFGLLHEITELVNDANFITADAYRKVTAKIYEVETSYFTEMENCANAEIIPL